MSTFQELGVQDARYVCWSRDRDLFDFKSFPSPSMRIAGRVYLFTRWIAAAIIGISPVDAISRCMFRGAGANARASGRPIRPSPERNFNRIARIIYLSSNCIVSGKGRRRRSLPPPLPETMLHKVINDHRGQCFKGAYGDTTQAFNPISKIQVTRVSSVRMWHLFHSGIQISME